MELKPFIDFLLRATGGVAIIGVLVLGFMKLFTEKWIENRFQAGLAAIRHKQDLELQRLRIEIDSKISANLKLQDKEFETLSKAWQLLQIAYIEIAAFVSVMEQYPDIDKLPESEIEEFLSDLPYTDRQKRRILNSKKKTETFCDVRFDYRSSQVWKAHLEFRDYILQYGIFFPEPVRKRFLEIEEQLRGAIIAKEVGRPHNNWEMQAQAWKDVAEKTKKVCDELQVEIHNRLTENARLESSS